MHLLNLKCCSRKTPIQVENEKPFFSWQIAAEGECAVVQTAYRLQVFDEEERVCWDSEKQNSDEMLQIVYQGEPLRPDSRYRWRLEVWTNVNEDPMT